MSRIFTILLALTFAAAVSAQPAKKKAQSKASAKTAVQSTPEPQVAASALPVLSKKEPKFAGFTGSFVKFGKAAGNSRPFSISVEYKPWFFEISGSANADHNTADLDILLDDIVGVLAYYDAPGKAPDGSTYQAGLFDFMLYLDDSPIKVSNLNFKLLSKAVAGNAVLRQAENWNFAPGAVFKQKKYDDPIFEAQADPLDKATLAKAEQAEKKRIADSIATEKKRVQDSIARVEKRRKDSIAAERRRVEDSIAEFEALKEQARKKAAAAKKKRPVVEEYDDEDEDEEEYVPVKKKKPAAKPAATKKKKRVVVEEYDDEDEEEYVPPVKKKKPVAAPAKKKKRVVDDDE
ncbi:hypothetical protein AGMMS49938_04690 [Fibrobacterales bacterium]|nr:hypothetical protein AGMMS49938_04690 [Fibrobacterales bacterium]